jgi:hypothetical protein
MQSQTLGVDNGRHWWEDATMLTLEDFVSQLVSRGSPNARVVFDNGSHLALEKIVAINPATEVWVVFKDEERESLKKLVEDLEEQTAIAQSDLKEKTRDIKSLIEDAEAEVWTTDQILKELKSL